MTFDSSSETASMEVVELEAGTCRLCLGGGARMPLSPSLLSRARAVCRLPLLPDARLPGQICLRCVRELQAARSFVISARAAQRRLMQLLDLAQLKPNGSAPLNEIGHLGQNAQMNYKTVFDVCENRPIDSDVKTKINTFLNRNKENPPEKRPYLTIEPLERTDRSATNVQTLERIDRSVTNVRTLNLDEPPSQKDDVNFEVDILPSYIKKTIQIDDVVPVKATIPKKICKPNPLLDKRFNKSIPNKGSKMRLTCTYCNPRSRPGYMMITKRGFGSLKSLKAHIAERHTVQRPLPSKEAVPYASDYKLYSCEICDINFYNRPSLVSHLSSPFHRLFLKEHASREKVYECKKCDATFNHRLFLNEHSCLPTEISDDPTLRCTECQTSFVNVESHDFIEHALKCQLDFPIAPVRVIENVQLTKLPIRNSIISTILNRDISD